MTPKIDTILYLKDKIKNGEEIDAPFLIIGEKCEIQGHEGRHRSIASQELGIKKIPVLLKFLYGSPLYPNKDLPKYSDNEITSKLTNKNNDWMSLINYYQPKAIIPNCCERTGVSTMECNFISQKDFDGERKQTNKTLSIKIANFDW